MSKTLDIQVELEFGSVGYYGGRKTREPREKPSEQGENQQQTQSTWQPLEPNLSHRGGRQV